jgi:hypothetical protein
MMNKRMPLVVVTGCLILGARIGGAPPERPLPMGAGAQSCGSWLAAREGAKSPMPRTREENILRKAMMLSWIQGLLHGLTATVPEPNRLQAMRLIPEAATVDAWLDKYCRDNPLDLIVFGGLELYKELLKRDMK